jgi:hypothetical protein
MAATTLINGGNARAIYLVFSGILEMLLAIIVSLNFFRFFDRFKNGALFDAKTVGHLQAAGKWWLAYWIFDFMFGLIGNGLLETGMVFSCGQLFASLTVIIVSWLLKEAQELQANRP